MFGQSRPHQAGLHLIVATPGEQKYLSITAVVTEPTIMKY